MKVVGIETFALRAEPAETYWGARTWSAGQRVTPYPPESRRHYLYSRTVDAALVRIETIDGVIGWGEAKAPVGVGATCTLIDELLAPLVTGSRVDEIAVTWDRMYAGMRVRGHDSGFWLEAISGVDIALWDAWGRTLGQPLHALLGGRQREQVPVYASGIPAAPAGSGADGLREVRAEAEKLRGLGYDAVKVAIGVDPDSDVASVAAVREVFDRVYADAAGQYDVRQALRVGRALEQLGVGFFEMPVPPENLDGYATLAARLDIPLALDSLAGRYRALQFLRRDALHVLQPDVCRAGGITETLRIAALADAFGVQATPHVSIGSAVHVAASLQCAAAIPNLEVMEYWIGTNPLGSSLATDLPAPAAGLLDVPRSPGLAVTIDEAAVRAGSLQQPAADDHPLDVGGALADQQHRGLPVEPLDLVLLGEAVAAVDPERVLHHLRAVLAGQVLRHPGLEVVARTGVLLPRRLHHQLVRRLDLGRHVGQPEQHRLVLGDLLAEGLPLLGVRDAELESPPRDTATTRGNVDPADFDPIHHLVEALARARRRGLAGVDAVAVEEHLGGVDALVAHLLDLARHGQARRDLTEARRPSRPGTWSCSCRPSPRPRRSSPAPRPGSTSRRWSATSSGR